MTTKRIASSGSLPARKAPQRIVDELFQFSPLIRFSCARRRDLLPLPIALRPRSCRCSSRRALWFPGRVQRPLPSRNPRTPKSSAGSSGRLVTRRVCPGYGTAATEFYSSATVGISSARSRSSAPRRTARTCTSSPLIVKTAR